MKKPKSELPWKMDDNIEMSLCIIEDNENGMAVMETAEGDKFTQREDVEYIVEACNNYPKAIELLKLASLYIDNVVGVSINDVQPEIDKFLNKVE